MSLSPTQRTLKALKAEGCKCAIVEKWNRFGGRKGGFGVRQDMFGIIDIIALDRIKGVRGIQSTGVSFSGHKKDLLGPKAEACIEWLLTPGTQLELWGWRKVKVKKGGKAVRYEPRVYVFKLKDFLTKAEIVKREKIRKEWYLNCDLF